MTDYTYIIPTIWDYLSNVIESWPFWLALGLFCIVTIGGVKILRKKRGWK